MLRLKVPSSARSHYLVVSPVRPFFRVFVRSDCDVNLFIVNDIAYVDIVQPSLFNICQRSADKLSRIGKLFVRHSIFAPHISLILAEYLVS